MLRPSKLIDIIAAVVALTALAVTWSVCARLPPRLDRQLHRDIGRALATEALALRRPQGGLTVISRDTQEFKQPALEALLQGFQSEVKRAGVRAPRLQWVQTDPLRPLDVPSGDFFELLRRSGPEHVIVSLLGPPLLTGEQRNKLPLSKPKVVAFCPGPLAESVDLRQLFEANLLHSAVVSRAADKMGKSPRQFDQLFRVVRASGEGEISAVSNGAGKDDR